MTEDEPALDLPGLVRDRAAEGRAKAAATRARKASDAEIADVDPVARVVLDLPMPHLDREFDYAVPAAMADAAQPGCRVKVRFAGQDVDGFVVARAADSDHQGRLMPLRRVVSPEPVLTPAVEALCRSVAEHYAGSAADVRRLAVPPRHATTEREQWPDDPFPTVDSADAVWSAYPAAAAFLQHVRNGGAPRAVWGAAPGEDWPRLLAALLADARAAGRGSVVCLPDHRDVARLDAALTALLGPGHHVVLGAAQGPAARYREFLLVARGQRRIVIGTRSAAFAPVADLGLAVCWDDGDDLHAEPRAPYPHVREVLRMRAEAEGAALLIGGFARSVEAEQLLRAGWAKEIAMPREALRERVLVGVTGASDHELVRDPLAPAVRIPRQVHDAIRWGLERGPVLVQTPRAGYALRLACDRCRTPARCLACTGPLEILDATQPPRCRWCGTEHDTWACATCGGRGLRAPVLGDARTADELGRAFPKVAVRTSSGQRVKASVGPESRIIVATPGAEPVADGGYAVVVLLDAWMLTSRDALRSEEEALRRWCNAVGLVAPGGRALVVGDPARPVLQSLVRWDPAAFALRESEERAAAHLPPGARLAVVSGEAGAVDDALTALDLPDEAEVLGPLPLDEGRERVVIRVPRTEGNRLAAALLELQRVRSARKLDPVRIQLDPPEL